MAADSARTDNTEGCNARSTLARGWEPALRATITTGTYLPNGCINLNSRVRGPNPAEYNPEMSAVRNV
jgi:hypothetical protein